MNLYGYAAGDPINSSDPFGLCPDVKVNGNDVTITARVTFTGSWSQADQTAVLNGIAGVWSGQKGKYNVTVNLVPASNTSSLAPVVEIERSTSGVNNGVSGGIRYGQAQGGVIGLVPGLSGQALAQGAAHEFGHVLGLPGGPGQHHPNLQNVMFATNRALGTDVAESQVQQAVAACATP